MVRQTRQKRKRSSTRRRKQRGGAPLDCEKEGFTLAMRYAAFGRGYNIDVGPIHKDGEKWSYDKLKDFSFHGIVKYWVKQLKAEGMEFTDEDMKALQTNETLSILGAFFHRYKVVAERLSAARGNLQKGIGHFFPTRANAKGLKGLNSYSKYLQLESAAKLSEAVKEKLKKLELFASSNIGAKDLPIESAIDKAQCIMYFITKHKGALPPGFVMDPRIEARAKKEILINKFDDDLQMFAAAKLDPTLAWLDFVEKEYTELNTPPVTYGVFD